MRRAYQAQPSSLAVGEHWGNHRLHDVYLEKLIEGQKRIETGIGTLQRSITLLSQRYQSPPYGDFHSNTGDLTEAQLPPTSTLESRQSIRRDSATTKEASAADGSFIQEGSGPLSPPSPRSRRRIDMVDSLREGLVPHPPFAECAKMMETHLEEVAASWTIAQPAVTKLFGTLASSHSITDGRVIWLPFHPTAWLPTVFECLSVLVLVADAMMIPVIVAWEFTLDGWLRYMAVFLFAFWVCDMLLKFCTGFIDDACVIQAWGPIIKRYLRRGFVFDLTLVLLDLLDLVYSLVTSSLSSRALKFIRFLRLTKMMRMFRLSTRIGGRRLPLLRVWIVRITIRWYGALPNIAWYLSLGSILVRLTFAILSLSHMLACAWYYLLQNAAPSYEGNWLEVVPDMSDMQMYQYAMYWSVTTMFAGSSFLPPVLGWEVLYATGVVLVGALFVTSITSTLAALLIEVQLSWVETKKKLASLTGFLEQRRMPGLVIMVALEEFSRRLSTSKSYLTEADVHAQLTMLSQNMRALLREEQYRTRFQKVHVFRLVATLQPVIVQELCCGAFFLQVGQGEEIFDVGEDLAQAMLLARGQACYTRWGNRHSLIRTTSVSTALSCARSEEVKADAWICEVALLLVWRTMGRFEAEIHSEVISVSTDAFTRAVSRLPSALAVVSSFCQELLVLMSASASRGEMETTDIRLGIDGDLVVSNMPRLVQHELVSTPALDVLRQQRRTFAMRFKGRGLVDLEHDIKLGQGYLTLAQDGQALRVIKMVSLHLEDQRGRLCAQLAEEAMGGTCSSAHLDFEVNFGLPGQAIEDNKSPMEVLDAMLKDRFHMLALGVHVQGLDNEPVIEYEKSRHFGIVTKYIKFVVRATLDGSIIVEGGGGGPRSDKETSHFAFARRHRSLTSSLGLSQVGSERLGAAPAFIIESKERGRVICRFFDKNDFEQRWNNREVEVAALKAWLTRTSPQRIDALSKWTFISRMGSMSRSQSPSASVDLKTSSSRDADEEPKQLTSEVVPSPTGTSATSAEPRNGLDILQPLGGEDMVVPPRESNEPLLCARLPPTTTLTYKELEL